MDEKWLSRLRGHMDGYEEQVPEGLWDDIARRLERSEPHAAARRSVIPPRIGRMAAAAAVAVLLVTGYGVLSYVDRQPAAVMPAEDTGPAIMAYADRPETAFTTETAPAKAETAAPQLQQLTEKQQLMKPQPRAGTNAPAAKPADMQAATAASEPSAATDAAHADETAAAAEGARRRVRTAKAGPRQEPAARKNGQVRRAADGGATTDAAHRGSKRAGRLTAGAYASGAAMASRSRTASGGGGMLTTSQYKESDDGTQTTADPITAIMLYNQNRPTATEIRHRQPITAGLTLRYGLTPRTGIESGFTYTLLSSSVRSGGEESYCDERRTLHYIGIPVNLTWTAWSNRRLALYLGGGGSVEKCVAGRARTDYVLHGGRGATSRRSMRPDELQWSAGVSAGLQCAIAPHVGIYAEPGLRYHFDNGSPIETVYRSRPLNFSLNLGIRISFR